MSALAPLADTKVPSGLACKRPRPESDTPLFDRTDFLSLPGLVDA